MSNNRDAARVTRLAAHGGDNLEPWRQLEQAVQEAVVRLKAAGYPGGREVKDSDGQAIVIWELPSVLAINGPIAFDADGRLLGYAKRIDRWYEWYKVNGKAPNGWMFYARNVDETETIFTKNWVDRLAR